MRAIRIAVLLAFSLATVGLLIWLLAPKAGAVSLGPKPTLGDAIWETADQSSIAAADWKAPAPESYRALHLNKDALARVLAGAPMERTGDLRKSRAVLSLPMPDGSFQSFRVEESPVMDAELVARYRQIKSYRGQGVDDPAMTVRFDSTPLGLHAVVLSAGRAVNILPPNQADTTTYASYEDQGELFKCGVTELHQTLERAAGASLPKVPVGTTLRTYRIAIAATNEFCTLLGNNNVADSTAAINTFLNGINAIWERELSVHMNLVNAPNVVYAADNTTCGGACTATNDPYTNGQTGVMLNEVRPDLAAKVGVANYDIGHVLGTNSGGIAYVGVVCRDGMCNAEAGACKGGGASGMGRPAGNLGSVGLWAHELGHQFGGNHTQNGTTSNCGGRNRSDATSWETGSGITIMSYNGICGSDNLLSTGRDLRFHAGTSGEITNFLASAQAMGCAVNTPTGNNIPTVDAGPPFTIPAKTPFTLTATGTDADPADVPNLTFVWEELDAGGTMFPNPPYGDQPGDPATTTRPLFRAFSPVKDKSRTFPSLTYILNNANVPPAVIAGNPADLGNFQSAESLPAVSRTMNFRCTVRDQRGGVQDSPVAITVDGNSGPFAVTSPNGGQTIGGVQNVTWSVNGTNAAPVNVANVKISLSFDGGNTFPTVLLASTPNNGSAMVTLPNGILNNTARIKVEAVGNIFFDISDANFGITPGDGCLAGSNFTPQFGQTGTVVTITGINFTGATGVTFNGTAATNFTVNSDTQITATVPAGATGGLIVVSKPGCANLTAGNFSLCPNPPTALAIDDGTLEFASGAGANDYLVNRLTPAAYPASVNQVSIYFRQFQKLPTGTPINVVAAANPGGTNNIDGLTFQSVPATVGTLDAFTTVNLPTGVTINSGDFVVGFQVVGTPPDGSLSGAVDQDNPQSRSYFGDGATFRVMADGNLMIRASQVFTGCSAGPATVQFAAGSARVAESAGTVNVLVVRTGDTSGTTTANFSTGGGTAVAGRDYTPQAGQITFNAGEVSKMISIPIMNHATEDPDETFMVRLDPPAGAAPLASTTGEPAPIEQEMITIEDGADVQPLEAVSRKLHNGTAFDIALDLSGSADAPPVVECRSGGPTNTHQIVFTFPEPVTLSGAAVLAGTGQASSISGGGTTEVRVNVTGVSDGQTITLNLASVDDGVVARDVSVSMSVLLGDANGDGVVNSADATITRNRSGQATDATNFRSDYNLDGSINAADATIVRSRSGNFVP